MYVNSTFINYSCKFEFSKQQLEALDWQIWITVLRFSSEHGLILPTTGK